MSEAARILRIVADQAAASPAASNPLAVSKADAWPNLSGPIWLTDMEARYIADPLLNAISFRGVGLDHTWTSSASSAGTFVPLTEIGRASCRARVCPYVMISVVADTYTTKNETVQNKLDK